MNFLQHLGRRISLRAGTDEDGTIERVRSGASLSAENFWLLGCSAMLASIGLDVGSAAVIIGAMLISPLMGPILGVGMGIGITNRDLLQRSLRELGLATIVTLVVSTCYFLISPLATPTAEMIARTRPTLLDVGIAFVGGVAGIVAGSRRQQSLALPGVAIATALMPPLCTAGFGLATGSWSFFFGAFYLYTLNAIFIGLSTLLVVRFLRFQHHVEVEEAGRLRERRWVAAVVILAMLPSVYFLYATVKQAREDQRIGAFIQEQIEGPDRSVPQWHRRRGQGEDRLRVYVAGHPIEASAQDSLHSRMSDYGLVGVTLEIIQSDISAEDLERLQGDVQRDIVQTVASAMAVRDSAAATRARQDSVRVELAVREVAPAFPEVTGASYTARRDLLANDTLATAPALLITFGPGISAGRQEEIASRLEALLRARLSQPRLAVMVR